MSTLQILKEVDCLMRSHGDWIPYTNSFKGCFFFDFYNPRNPRRKMSKFLNRFFVLLLLLGSLVILSTGCFSTNGNNQCHAKSSSLVEEILEDVVEDVVEKELGI